MSNRPLNNCCNEKVIRELFKKHARDLYHFIYYRYGSENHPKDLVQDAFLKLWKNCHKVLPEKARSYLFTVANNQMLNNVEKKKTALKYFLYVSKENGFESADPEQENEYLTLLKNALEELTEEQRTTLLLNRIEGKKHKEIAEMLGISRKAVEKRIYTALSILREKMGKKIFE